MPALVLRGERHHNSTHPQTTGEPAVVFDLGDPLRDQRKTPLPQCQQLAAEPLCVGSQHAGCDEACGFIPIAADHADCMTTSGQLMGDGQAHQPSAQHDDRWCCGHGWQRSALKPLFSRWFRPIKADKKSAVAGFMLSIGPCQS